MGRFHRGNEKTDINVVVVVVVVVEMVTIFE